MVGSEWLVTVQSQSKQGGGMRLLLRARLAKAEAQWNLRDVRRLAARGGAGSSHCDVGGQAGGGTRVSDARIIPLHRKRQLATRIRLGGYYTDGRALFEIEGIGVTGCVTVRSAWNGGTRCFDITDFRRMFWLVRDPAESEAA